jgi:hypothetical protein
VKTAFVAAWLVAEGIIVYRAVKQQKRPPSPGELLWSSGLFVLLALLSEANEQFAALLAWGFVAAAAMNLAPVITGGGTGSSTSASSASSEAKSKGGS